MDSALYSKFTGTDLSVDRIDADQVSFLKCENFVPNRTLHVLYPRGGSYGYSVAGDIWGLSGYVKETASARVPVTEVMLRHRRLVSTSYLEKLDYTTNTWSAITQGPNTSLDIGNIWSTAQIGDLLCIAAGRPGKITDISGGSFTRLGGPPPNSAPTLTATGTGLTGTFSYFYTFYDSTSGWESSPSAVTGLFTVSNQSIQLSNLQTTCARESVDKIRIYRTVETGEAPYFFVTELAIGSTIYVDSTLSEALQQVGPEFNDHDPPPIESYICIAHEDRLWIVDNGNPKACWYSKPFAGDYANLEYFSPSRVEYLPKRITGLASRPSGGLLFFQPPGFGIHELLGRSESQFERQIAFPREGTSFHTSVSNNGTTVAFWAEDGPAFIGPEGVSRRLSYPAANLLRDALIREYNNNMFVFTVYSRANRQFIFAFSASDTAASDWYDEETGIPSPWIEEAGGSNVGWVTDDASPGPDGTNWWLGRWWLGSWYGGSWI